MNFIRRIGYDAGATPLEDGLAATAQHGFHYLDFSADACPNRLDNWPDHRIRAVRAAMALHNIALTRPYRILGQCRRIRPRCRPGRGRLPARQH